VTHRIVENIVRPPDDLVEFFADAAAADVHEAMGKRGAMAPEISPATSSTRLCGPAVTVSLPPGDNAGIHIASSLANRGDVIVIATETTHAATWGELATQNALNMGLQGVVSDGNVRDIEALDNLEFPVFSRAIGQNGAIKQQPGSINIPVTVGGIPVFPGDIIVGDADGVTVVPREHALTIKEATEAKVVAEADLKAQMAKGASLPDLLDVWDLVPDEIRVEDTVDYK
jgi:4-hydroxy-4-methyl-2-oxoglutarate aldolase